MTRDERDTTRPEPNHWRSVAGFAVLLAAVSVVPVPGGVVGTAVGDSGTGGGGVVPAFVGLTDPFHVLGYAVLAALMARATGRTHRELVIAVLAATAFGFVIELVQAPIPWRTFAWRDVGLNGVGAAVGAAAAAATAACKRWYARSSW